jgi:hypothetical protein
MTTNHATNPIEAVVLKQEPEGVLEATVVLRDPNAGEVAFYLYRNEKRIRDQWYSSNRTFRVSTDGQPGLYRVLVFLRLPTGLLITRYSNPVFLNPVVYRLGQTFQKPPSEERAFLLEGRRWKFPALYYPGQPEQPLFVMLSNRVDRDKHTLPAFSRWSWAEQHKFPGHVLCVADPTLDLHEELGLGWYLGTTDQDAGDELATLIRCFAEGLGIPNGKIIFWGSSGGGFGALALAARIENTTAVAINAQTDLFAYEIPEAIESIRKHCFGGKSIAHIQAQYGARINMAQAWQKNRSSRAILIQNTLDAHHYVCHFKPFWEALGGQAEGGAAADGRLFAWLYRDSHGHVPESIEMIPDILRLLDHGSFTSAPVMSARRVANG